MISSFSFFSFPLCTLWHDPSLSVEVLGAPGSAVHASGAQARGPPLQGTRFLVMAVTPPASTSLRATHRSR